MLSASDILHLPYTDNLTEGGMTYALHSIPYLYNRMGVYAHDALRRAVASAAVQLAFRRYLFEQKIPLEVMGAAPFAEHDRYDVSLGGRRCDLHSFLISQRDNITKIQSDP